jgi:hypothetical protein
MYNFIFWVIYRQNEAKNKSKLLSKSNAEILKKAEGIFLSRSGKDTQ